VRGRLQDHDIDVGSVWSESMSEVLEQTSDYCNIDKGFGRKARMLLEAIRNPTHLAIMNIADEWHAYTYC
jgi:hypothetical protein